MGSELFDLSGKVAIITGASRGIGLAIAEAFSDANAKVVLSSRKQEDLDQAAEKINAAGGEARAIAAHTGDAEAIHHLLEKTIDTFGGVDILVNNAGTNPHFGPLLTAEESHWDKILDVNLKGYFRMIKACATSMRERGGGKVINMASVSGLRATPGLGIYGVSKAGVLMLTKVLAVELAADNIQVNAIAPGLIKTRFSRALWETPSLQKSVMGNIPQGRVGLPEEVTGIALYLASQASSFTTGGVFVVDGGQIV
ncbi:MAG: glucose 1-dehydrogenase [Anaerolineales bacterium]|jgi:NAD(P)-dependent dehydrogenase (short-subunit alcohol dehydrogenase family)